MTHFTSLLTSLLKFLVVPVALLSGGIVHAQQTQQSTFNVSVTFVPATQAMAAAQLCSQGKPQGLLTVSAVRVDCPVGNSVKSAFRQSTVEQGLTTVFKSNEVVVTF